MCWQKIRRDRMRNHLNSRKNQSSNERYEKIELKRAITRSAIEFTISHSGKILALLGAIFIYVSE